MGHWIVFIHFVWGHFTIGQIYYMKLASSMEDQAYGLICYQLMLA